MCCFIVHEHDCDNGIGSDKSCDRDADSDSFPNCSWSCCISTLTVHQVAGREMQKCTKLKTSTPTDEAVSRCKQKVWNPSRLVDDWWPEK